MTFTALNRATLTGIGLATAAITLPSSAMAQDGLPDLPDVQVLSDEESLALPRDMQTAPVQTTQAAISDPGETLTETVIGPDGVETITRTRRIVRRAPATQNVTRYVTEEEYEVELPAQHNGAGHYSQSYAPAYAGHYSHAYAPGAQVFQRDQWIAECERRTDGHRGRKKGGIIGGLLGAIAGGIIGNRAFDSERLGGTLLGAGVGGLGGALLGSLIGGGRNDRGEYDCEAALDAYLSQHAIGGPRIAARTIPARGPVYAPAAPVYAAPSYTYAAPQYYYQPPQQIIYVPVEYQQRRRVIVRETVREEVVPGATRTIPAPRPEPQPVARPLPRPIKGKLRPIKGN